MTQTTTESTTTFRTPRVDDAKEMVRLAAASRVLDVRGRGMMLGLGCPDCPQLAEAVSAAAFKRGLIIETSGTDGHVLKLLPPLTIEDEQLKSGLEIIEDSYTTVLSDSSMRRELELVDAD